MWILNRSDDFTLYYKIEHLVSGMDITTSSGYVLYYENSTLAVTSIDNGSVVTTNGSKEPDYYDYFGVDSHTQHTIYKAAEMLIKVVFPLLVVLGTVANTLVVVVLRRGAINTDNLSFFLSALAVVDTTFLYTSAFKTWLRVVWGFELLHFGSWSCKLGLFLNSLSLTLSAWLVVVIAWQRWYTCSRPFDRCCPVESSRCGYVGLIGLLLILVGANSYVLVTVELHKTPWEKRCAPDEQYDYVISEIFPYIVMVLYSGLPALLLLVLNGLLARVLYISRRSLLSHTDSARCNHRDDRHVRARYNYVTALLMVLSVSWFLLTMPHTLFKTVEQVAETSHEAAVQTFLNVLFFVFLYINHSINFFLYCALMRGFRRELKKIASSISACVISVSHCCASHCSRQRQQPLDASSTINDSNNRESHTDSFIPLLEQNAGKHPPGRTHNSCLINGRGRTCV